MLPLAAPLQLEREAPAPLPMMRTSLVRWKAALRDGAVAVALGVDVVAADDFAMRTCDGGGLCWRSCASRSCSGQV